MHWLDVLLLGWLLKQLVTLPILVGAASEKETVETNDFICHLGAVLSSCAVVAPV